jgi:hypothetical protein
MNKNSAVKQRVKEFVKYKKISVRSFEHDCGLSYSYVNSIRVSIQPDKVHKIALAIPDLNTGWLLTGEGEMLKNNEPKSNDMDYKEKYYELLEKYTALLEERAELKDSVEGAVGDVRAES